MKVLSTSYWDLDSARAERLTKKQLQQKTTELLAAAGPEDANLARDLRRFQHQLKSMKECSAEALAVESMHTVMSYNDVYVDLPLTLGLLGGGAYLGARYGGTALTTLLGAGAGLATGLAIGLGTLELRTRQDRAFQHALGTVAQACLN